MVYSSNGDKMGVIRGSLEVLPDGVFTIEPREALEDWGISPDSVAEIVRALSRNMPEGWYFWDLSLKIEPAEE